ncbi:hypothetical protein EAH83_06170 [Variovorax ginsengisoli]|uniref:Uncharacterized protein n=2 Tax=Variovorax guangxiensis TaxID=1775474 RepID=A0A502DCR4_9BURK|nr:hypothetical protein EAH82_20550 [Variovorax guangxiensis]TPG24084.1 hypothetical protein EAH83_06170 [Variovorax ginsengisoli]
MLMTITNKRGKVFYRTKDRLFDLFDNLMAWWSPATRTVYLSISSKGADWKRWDDHNLLAVESLIRYDFNFDGCSVKVERLTASARALPCTEPFQWRLRIRDTAR